MNYLFIVDTENYSGNFKCAMSSYMVGHPKSTQSFTDEVGDPDDIFGNISYNDSDNCTELYPTPGWFNHGSGGHFKHGDEVNALLHYKSVKQEYYQKRLNDVKLIENKINDGKSHAGWTIKNVQDEILRIESQKHADLNKEQVSKYPAYMSLAIYFDNRPTENQIKIMKERAFKFALNNNITITGFRIAKVETVYTYEAV